MRTEDQARQRIGAVVFCAGAVATLAWAVGALLTLLDLALGATAPTYMPWLAAGAIPVTIAVAGVWLHGGMPWKDGIKLLL